MAAVVLNEIGKEYPGGVAAVKGLSLDITDGEFVVLVGPSGCGKTTTLRMIAGLEDVTSGTISIGGRVVNEVHPRDRDIAMVFQNYALYPHMSVRKNMSFALKMRKIPKAEIERRVNDAAKTLGLTELMERKPRQLSGGQRQRVAVGRAIVREPKAFLFDEPLSNLDAKLRVTTRAELKSLHQRLKTTTVYVTHDQEEAMTLGDRIVVMSGGQIQQAGPPLDVYRRPANRFVASFIGTPPMNFISGKLIANPTTIPLSGELAATLRPHLGRPVVMGLRPQGLSENPAAAFLELTVNVVEPLGDTVDLTCSTDSGITLVARIPARRLIKPGNRIRFGLDFEHLHFFEPGDLGKSLLHNHVPR